MADNHPLRHRVSKFYRARQLLRAVSQDPLPPWAQFITGNDVQLAHRWCDLLDDGWVEDPDPPMVDDQGRDIGEPWPAKWATSSKSLKTFLTKYFRGLWMADLASIELEVARAAEEHDEDEEQVGQAPREVRQPQQSPSSPVHQAFDNDDDDYAVVNRSMRGLNLGNNTRVRSQSRPRPQRGPSQSRHQEERRQQSVAPAGDGPASARTNDYQIPGAFVDDNGDEENQEGKEENTEAGPRSRRLSGGPSSSSNTRIDLEERQHRKDKRLLSKYIRDFRKERAKMKGQGEDKGRAVV